MNSKTSSSRTPKSIKQSSKMSMNNKSNYFKNYMNQYNELKDQKGFRKNLPNEHLLFNKKINVLLDIVEPSEYHHLLQIDKIIQYATLSIENYEKIILKNISETYEQNIAKFNAILKNANYFFEYEFSTDEQQIDNEHSIQNDKEFSKHMLKYILNLESFINNIYESSQNYKNISELKKSVELFKPLVEDVTDFCDINSSVYIKTLSYTIDPFEKYFDTKNKDLNFFDIVHKSPEKAPPNLKKNREQLIKEYIQENKNDTSKCDENASISLDNFKNKDYPLSKLQLITKLNNKSRNPDCYYAPVLYKTLKTTYKPEQTNFINPYTRTPILQSDIEDLMKIMRFISPGIPDIQNSNDDKYIIEYDTLLKVVVFQENIKDLYGNNSRLYNCIYLCRKFNMDIIKIFEICRIPYVNQYQPLIDKINQIILNLFDKKRLLYFYTRPFFKNIVNTEYSHILEFEWNNLYSIKWKSSIFYRKNNDINRDIEKQFNIIIKELSS